MKKTLQIFCVLMVGVFCVALSAKTERKKPQPMFPKHKRNQIGSVPPPDVTVIKKTETKIRIGYEASYKSETDEGESTGSILCWKDKKSGRIGCTESGVIFTRSGAPNYSRPIADENFDKMEKLFKEQKKK